jgi:hypothetical protein
MSLARHRLLLVAIAALLTVGALLAWKGDKVVDRVLEMRYGAVLPAPAYPAPRSQAEANLQDLDYISRFTEVDRSFGDDARVEFARRISKLKERAGNMSRGQLLMGLAKALAVADNPHTNVERAYWRAYLNSAPVRFEWFEEGLFIVRARAGEDFFLGARVLAIDGLSPELIVRDASKYFGGPPEHGRVSSLLVMESPEAMHEIYPEAPDDRLVLALEELSGRTVRVEFRAVDPREASPVVRPGRLLSPQTEFDDKVPMWRSLFDPDARVPPSLREPGRNLYVERLAEDVLYLHLWSIHSDAKGKLGDQILDALRGRDRWRRVILDLRFDTGGDFPELFQAMKELPAHLAPEGKVVVITDNTTFSAAIITAALARHFGGDRTVIVGERPRDRLVFWAEGNQVRLPNSKIEIPVSTGMHDWARGCRDWSRCHWPNIWYGSIGVGSVEPDVKASWSFADYRKGVDTVLQRALQQ